MEEKKLDKYIVNEDVRLALRGIALRIKKDISPEVYKCLIDIINEDKMTDCYIDFLINEFNVNDIEYTDDELLEQPGWYI